MASKPIARDEAFFTPGDLFFSFAQGVRWADAHPRLPEEDPEERHERALDIAERLLASQGARLVERLPLRSRAARKLRTLSQALSRWAQHLEAV